MIKYEFDEINTNLTWDEIFKIINNNFKKAQSYFEDLGPRLHVEQFVATEGQTDFTLKEPYNTKRNCVSVYLNGSRQWLGSGFIELSTTSIRLDSPCRANDEVVILYTKFESMTDS